MVLLSNLKRKNYERQTAHRPGRWGGVSDYTHVITPTFVERDRTGYWKTEPDSSLEPPTYGDYEVSYLYTFRFYDTYISLEQHGGGGGDEDIDDILPATLRYFGRFDTKELYDFGSVVDVTEITHPFFKLTDVGVPIPIYISTTPPHGCPKPLSSLRAKNRHLFAEVA